jgi:hypothetical protein
MTGTAITPSRAEFIELGGPKFWLTLKHRLLHSSNWSAMVMASCLNQWNMASDGAGIHLLVVTHVEH